MTAEDLARQLPRLGGERGVSDAQALFDLGESADSGVARDKDRYVREAVESMR